MNTRTNYEMSEPPVISLDTYPATSSKFHLVHENFGYAETLEDAYDVVNEHIEKTLARFTVWSSSKDFGTSSWSLNNHRIQWEENGKYQGEKFGFDGVPFIYVGTRVLECQHGVDRNVGQKRKWKERKNEGDVHFRKSKKMNCPAKIVLREIVKFPMHRVTQNSEWRKKQMSRLLREAILSEELVCTERRFYVELPKVEDHKHQEVVASEERISIEHVIDERLMSRIEILVIQGMRSVDDLQQHLVRYVENELFANETPPPRPNRKYYPSKKDVRRLAYYARLKHRCNSSGSCQTARDTNDGVQTIHLNITGELPEHQAWDCTTVTSEASYMWGEKVRNLLQEIEMATYTADESETLEAVHSDLTKALDKLKGSCKSESRSSCDSAPLKQCIPQCTLPCDVEQPEVIISQFEEAFLPNISVIHFS